MNPAGNGWVETNDCLVPQLMSMEAAPDSILFLTRCGCSAGCVQNCKCAKHGLSCTDACKCTADANYRNPSEEVHGDSDTDYE